MWQRSSNICNALSYSPNSSELSQNQGKLMSGMGMGDSTTYGDEGSDSFSGLERDDGLSAALGIFIPFYHAEKQMTSRQIKLC